jgi:P27 family predicted phage terminase small subunit
MARPRKPTALKELAGTAQPCRINPDEPKPPAADETLAGDPPAFLSERGARHWPDLVKLTSDMGVLTVADGYALAETCEALAELHEARQSLANPLTARIRNKETGEVQDIEIAQAGERSYASWGKDGVMFRPRPEIARINEAFRRLALLLSKFGLTPADRSRVAAAPKGEVNEFDDI